MPDYQLTFDGDTTHDLASAPLDVLRCEGGCNRQLTRMELHPTEAGLMCQECLDDLYVTCTDCGRLMPYNSWGECEGMANSPDGVCRCHECHRRVYSRCVRCGRFTHREDGNVCVNPHRSEEEYCQDCWNCQWFTCTHCGDVDDRRNERNTPGNERLCSDCFDESYRACSACNRALPMDDYFGWEGDPYCESCYGNAETWLVQPWKGEATTFDRVGSRRRFGVELETSDCRNYRDLQCGTDWGCVYECSTSGMEFISPILQGDEGFDAIREVCNFADRNDWQTSSSCGLHIHLDLSEDSSDECLKMAYAYRRTYPLWKKFVRSHRTGNSMCGSPQYSTNDILACEHIEDFAEARDRFEFVNWRSFIRHGSFEVRVYQGSLNAREVGNWIALHARFMDAVKCMTLDEIKTTFGAITRINWRGLCEVIGDPDLLDYWRRKALRCGHDLPALWEGESAPADDVWTATDGRTVVSELAINTGDVDLDELTDGARVDYDSCQRAYMFRS